MTVPQERDPSEKLCEEILAEGRRQAEAIREDARKEGEALIARAEANAKRLRRDSLERAHREADRLREKILADLPIEIARIRAARTEALLDALRKGARQALLARQGFDYREALVALAVEALQVMRGEGFTLALAPGDTFEGMAEEIHRRVGRARLSIRLVEDPTITGGGMVLRNLEGRQVWDDRLPERLERLWPSLRIPLAQHLGLLGEP